MAKILKRHLISIVKTRANIGGGVIVYWSSWFIYIRLNRKMYICRFVVFLCDALIVVLSLYNFSTLRSGSACYVLLSLNKFLFYLVWIQFVGFSVAWFTQGLRDLVILSKPWRIKARSKNAKLIKDSYIYI